MRPSERGPGEQQVRIATRTRSTPSASKTRRLVERGLDVLVERLGALTLGHGEPQPADIAAHERACGIGGGDRVEDERGILDRAGDGAGMAHRP